MIKNICIDSETIFKCYGKHTVIPGIDEDVMIAWTIYDGINDKITIQSIMFNIKNGYPRDYFVVGEAEQIKSIFYTLYKDKTAQELVEFLK